MKVFQRTEAVLHVFIGDEGADAVEIIIIGNLGIAEGDGFEAVNARGWRRV